MVLIFICKYLVSCMDPEGGQGKNHKNIGSLRNTGPDALKITMLPSQHLMMGHHLYASETPFKWRFPSRRMMSHL